jgi:site-specific DNA-adenine methylase
MFPYYGSKQSLIDKYPPPKLNTIIEPFAGSAQYSLRYFERDVILIDRDKKIVDIWNWLKQVTVSEIMKLPDLGRQGRYDEISWSCQAEADYMGYLIKYASADPGRTVSPKIRAERPNRVKFNLEKTANSLHKIKHWTILHSSYEDAPQIEATWFIDPPYVVGGNQYKFGSKRINYQELGRWCMSRPGQIIVCENDGGYWLPFRDLQKRQGPAGIKMERVFTREPYFYQQKMF